MVQEVIKDQLAQMAALVEQKVQEGVNNKVAELQQAAEPKTSSCAKVPPEGSVKPESPAAMLHACDGTFQSPCDASILHEMLCDAFSNMLAPDFGISQLSILPFSNVF